MHDDAGLNESHCINYMVSSIFYPARYGLWEDEIKKIGLEGVAPLLKLISKEFETQMPAQDRGTPSSEELSLLIENLVNEIAKREREREKECRGRPIFGRRD